MARSLTAGETFIIGIVTGLISGGYLWLAKNSIGIAKFPVSQFVQPEKVSHIAQQFPQDEELFIYRAWDFVHRNIRYRPFGTRIKLYDSIAHCHKCLLPEEVLARREANCVGLSSLLISILRNRIPPERVLMVLGELRLDSVGGHSWIMLNFNGQWVVLEPTSPPGKLYSLEKVSHIYIPYAFFNDKYFNCISEELCIRIR